MPVEFIENKATAADENALGQLLGGKHLFSEEYAGHGELSMLACTWEPADEAARWLYEQFPEVRVALIPEAPR